MEPLPEQKFEGIRSSNGAVLPAINTQSLAHDQLSSDMLPAKRPKLKHNRYKIKGTKQSSPKHVRKDSVALHQSIVQSQRQANPNAY